jgi:hypothetical protein
MKKIIILILLFHYIPNLDHLQAQSLANLDRKKGFNKFTLGAPIASYTHSLKFRFAGQKGEKYYQYVGRDLTQLFGINIGEINLGFYKNKLYTISIDLGGIDGQDGKHILAKLIELFGIPRKSNDESNTNYDWQYQWITKKVLLGFSKYSCLSKIGSNCEGELFLISKEIDSAMNNDQF